MTSSTNLDVGKHPGCSLRGALIILAVCALTINVATRYSAWGSETPGVRTVSVVKSASAGSQRQRLLSNGLHWMSPAPSSTFFHPPRVSLPAVSAVFPAIHLDSESWLYNRPPPSC